MKLLGALCLAIVLATWWYLTRSPRYYPTRYVGADDEGDALPAMFV